MLGSRLNATALSYKSLEGSGWHLSIHSGLQALHAVSWHARALRARACAPPRITEQHQRYAPAFEGLPLRGGALLRGGRYWARLAVKITAPAVLRCIVLHACTTLLYRILKPPRQVRQHIAQHSGGQHVI